MNARDQFWMVYGEGRSAPTVKHSSFDAASREAKRLAAVAPGTKFYVLSAIAVAHKIEVAFEMLDEFPF